MCINKVTGFEFAGKIYEHEVDAIKAALTEIGTRIVKDFHANPFDGLLEHGKDVSHLRTRFMDLIEAAEWAKRDTAPVPVPTLPRDDLINKVDNWRRASSDHDRRIAAEIAKLGFRYGQSFYEADYEVIETLAQRLGILEVTSENGGRP